MIWFGVAAFVLVVLELVAAGVGVAVARRAWRQVAPQVRPLLSMFAPPQAPEPERCSYRGVDGDRCELAAGHDGYHEWPSRNRDVAAVFPPPPVDC